MTTAESPNKPANTAKNAPAIWLTRWQANALLVLLMTSVGVAMASAYDARVSRNTTEADRNEVARERQATERAASTTLVAAGEAGQAKESAVSAASAAASALVHVKEETAEFTKEGVKIRREIGQFRSVNAKSKEQMKAFLATMQKMLEPTAGVVSDGTPIIESARPPTTPVAPLPAR